jgi:hypothetical protein
MSMDKRTFEIAESVDVDFMTDIWQVRLLNKDYRVGAGLYLMVPVVDCEAAERLKTFIGELSSGSHVGVSQ